MTLRVCDFTGRVLELETWVFKLIRSEGPEVWEVLALFLPTLVAMPPWTQVLCKSHFSGKGHWRVGEGLHRELSLRVMRVQEGSRHKLGLELGNKVSFQLLVGSHVAL